jgi:uncharacterized protein (TIRG00374 family)
MATELVSRGLETEEARGSLIRKIVPKLAISALLGAAFAWLVARGGVPLIPSAEAFSEVRWGLVFVYAVSLLITHFFRASRWRFLIAPIKRLSLREVIAINWIGFFAIMMLPLRLGEIARPAVSKLRHGITFSAGLGTVAAERVIDGLITSACVVWAIFILPRVPTKDVIAANLPTYGFFSLLLFSTAFLLLVLFLWQRRFAMRAVRKCVGIFSVKLGEVVASKVGSLADGLRSVGDFGLIVCFLTESALYWGSNIVGMWLLAHACGLPLTIGHATAVMGVLAIGILLPTGPGLFGNFQLAISAGLKLYFAETLVTSHGAVYIFIMYAIQLAVISLAGIIPLYAMNLSLRDLLRLTSKPEE